jgi:hypothetical protein
MPLRTRPGQTQTPCTSTPSLRQNAKLIRFKKVVSKIEENRLLSPNQCKLLVLDEMGYDCIACIPWVSDLVDYATRKSWILKNVLNLRRIDPDHPGGKP